MVKSLAQYLGSNLRLTPYLTIIKVCSRVLGWILCTKATDRATLIMLVVADHCSPPKISYSNIMAQLRTVKDSKIITITIMVSISRCNR